MKRNLKKEKIKAELRNILKLIYQAQESYKILHCLWTTSNDDVIDGIKYRSYFFQYCKERFFKDTIIELAKLFNSTDVEHFNLKAFKNKLYKEDDYNGIIPTDTLKNWSKMLKDADKVITNIVKNRNGYVAHTDRDFKPENFPLSLSDLSLVIGIAQKIAKDIYWILDSSAFQIESPVGAPVDSLNRHLTELAEREKERLRPLFKHALDYNLNEEIPDWYNNEDEKFSQ